MLKIFFYDCKGEIKLKKNVLALSKKYLYRNEFNDMECSGSGKKKHLKFEYICHDTPCHLLTHCRLHLSRVTVHLPTDAIFFKSSKRSSYVSLMTKQLK